MRKTIWFGLCSWTLILRGSHAQQKFEYTVNYEGVNEILNDDDNQQSLLLDNQIKSYNNQKCN